MSAWGPHQGGGLRWHLAMGHQRQQEGGGRGEEIVVMLLSGTVKQAMVSGC